jgi:sulfatase modifying factor 1
MNKKTMHTFPVTTICIMAFLSALWPAPVHAQSADEALLKLYSDRMTSIDHSADWRLFDSDVVRGLEFYYDSKNMTDLQGKPKGLYVKTVYTNQKAITELKKRREREIKMRSSSAEIYGKFESLAYSLQQYEIHCSEGAMGVDSAVFDLDKAGNLINFYQGFRMQFKILADSSGEKLYNLVCPKNAMKKGDEKPRTASMTASTTIYRDPVTGMELVFVKGGCFQMGTSQKTGNPTAQMPVHEVCVNDFYIGKFEVTQAQWRSVMGSDPIHTIQCTEDCPAVFVSYITAQEFIDKLNGVTKKKFRLPTEAEWEYAARGRGQAQKYPGTDIDSNLGDYAWYSANSSGHMHPVGLKKPNGLGLYDMSGNIWEMVGDWYSMSYDAKNPKDNPTGPATGEERVVRGCDYQCGASGMHVSQRAGHSLKMRDSSTGFRLVLQP